ncbi:MAG: cytosine permease, partial [Planctomycetota bacterium]
RKSDAVPASILSYGLGYPCILLLAGVSVLNSDAPDIVSAMELMGLGLPALFVMVFATWTTNVNNLYSASLSVARVVPGYSDWKVTTVCGVVGTVMAAAGIMNHFIDFLILWGVFIPPIAGIYLSDFFFRGDSEIRRHDDKARTESVFSWSAGGAWLLGSGWGTLAYFLPSITVTGIPAIDTLCVAVVAYVLLRRVAN